MFLYSQLVHGGLVLIYCIRPGNKKGEEIDEGSLRKLVLK